MKQDGVTTFYFAYLIPGNYRNIAEITSVARFRPGETGVILLGYTTFSRTVHATLIAYGSQSGS